MTPERMVNPFARSGLGALGSAADDALIDKIMHSFEGQADCSGICAGINLGQLQKDLGGAIGSTVSCVGAVTGTVFTTAVGAVASVFTLGAAVTPTVLADIGLISLDVATCVTAAIKDAGAAAELAKDFPCINCQAAASVFNGKTALSEIPLGEISRDLHSFGLRDKFINAAYQIVYGQAPGPTALNQLQRVKWNSAANLLNEMRIPAYSPESMAFADQLIRLAQISTPDLISLAVAVSTNDPSQLPSGWDMQSAQNVYPAAGGMIAKQQLAPQIAAKANSVYQVNLAAALAKQQQILQTTGNKGAAVTAATRPGTNLVADAATLQTAAAQWTPAQQAQLAAAIPLPPGAIPNGPAQLAPISAPGAFIDEATGQPIPPAVPAASGSTLLLGAAAAALLLWAVTRQKA